MGKSSSQSPQDALEWAVQAPEPLPGVAACITGREGARFVGAAGHRAVDAGEAQGPALDRDTVFALFSCSKPITATALLQLVEEGRLDLETPVAEQVPSLVGSLGRPSRLEPAADGAPVAVPASHPITPRHLLLHTAGFGYPFFSPLLQAWMAATGLPEITAARREALDAPLLAEPGARWTYGIATDWCGRLIEEVEGAPLEAVLRRRVLDPLGMTQTTFTPPRALRRRMMRMHQRAPDGSLQLRRDLELPPRPEQAMGGHGLYAPLGDVARFLRMLLCSGRTPDGGALLAPGTVDWALDPKGPWPALEPLQTTDPAITLDLPLDAREGGPPPRWGPFGAFLDGDAPVVRWCGLANLHYWVDRRAGEAGVWATQVLPCADPAAVRAYRAFATGLDRRFN